MATARDNLARKQIYIPATQPEEEIVLRVAAYCRVSTDSEDQINSFTSQNNHYNEMITAHDRWELVDVYKEQRERISAQLRNSDAAQEHVRTIAAVLDQEDHHLTEWDEEMIRQLVHTVKVISTDHIRAYLNDGTEIDQTVGP